MPVITLTTDFGLEDGYVAAMKGVILALIPHATLVDVSHLVPPHDTLRAALLLESILPHFPADTIHLVVVDPAVGSGRRGLAVCTAHGLCVGPDNGVLTPALELPGPVEVVHLTECRFWRAVVSPTFQGRDIFAPVAGHLACGVPLETLGHRITDPARHTLPRATRTGPDEWQAEVIHADRFGNLITSLRAEDLAGEPGRWVVCLAGHTIRGLRRTYADAAPGALLALVGSGGRVEIAIREGSAAERLHVESPAAIIARYDVPSNTL